MYQHLEGPRPEGEIDLLQAYANCADDRRDDCGDPKRRHQGQRNRHRGTLHDKTETVGPEAEEHAMPERDHAGVSHQQIERSGEKAHCRAADHEIEQRLAAREQRQDRQYQQHGERDQDVPIGPAP